MVHTVWSGTVNGVLAPTGASKAAVRSGGADRAEPDRPQGLDRAELKVARGGFLMAHAGAKDWAALKLEVAALTASGATQTELIAKMEARIATLESSMPARATCWEVQQLQRRFDRKRARSSSSDCDRDSDSERGSNSSDESCAHLSITCAGMQVQAVGTGLADHVVQACIRKIERQMKVFYDSDDCEGEHIQIEVDIHPDEGSLSANAVRCEFDGAHYGLDKAACEQWLRGVLIKHQVL